MNESMARWLARWNTQPPLDTLSDAGTGSETTFYDTLTWPTGTLMCLGIVAFVWLAFWLRRERGNLRSISFAVLWSLRAVAVWVLLAMLMGWMFQQHRTDLPDLILAVDVSSSMRTQTTPATAAETTLLTTRLAASGLTEATRLNLAKLILLEQDAAALAALQKNFRVRLFSLGESTRAIAGADKTIAEELKALEANDAASLLGTGLREVLEAQRGRSTAAVILFSDGINTAGKSLADAADYARRKTIPFYCVGIGDAEPPRDVRLSDLLVEREAFVNDWVPLEATVSQVGNVTGEVKVILRTVGSNENLAEEIVSFTAGEKSKRVRLAHRPEKIGTWEYELKIIGQEQDRQPDNDTLTAAVQVHDATLRVLLVQSAPSFEFRFLKTLLERELNPRDAGEAGQRGFRVVLQEADVQFSTTDRSALAQFPVTKEELFQYDVLLLGDANPALFSSSSWQHIQSFVADKGGGLMFIAGPQFNPVAYRDTPLAPLLPINPATTRQPSSEDDLSQEVRPQPTALGYSSGLLQLVDSHVENRELWSRSLPGVYWFVNSPDVRPGARVLLAHPTLTTSSGTPLPMLSMQFVGAGKVMFQAFDGSYRWRQRVGDEYFSRYWIQTIRYLARGKVLGKDRAAELTADRHEYRRGEPVQLQVRFGDDRQAPADDAGVSIMLERTGMPRRALVATRSGVQRGLFSVVVNQLGEGKYRAWLASPTLAEAPPEENFQVLAPPGEQAQLEMEAAELRAAAEISGGKYVAWEQAEELWPQLPPGRPVRLESQTPQPLWNSPVLAGLFVGCIVMEWLLRKTWGML
jgi:von Willebrand factor type A domain